jgi:hypothetical protein
MISPKVLLVCGSMNQTTMMHKISRFLSECDCWFSPYWADGLVDKMARAGWLDATILGNKRAGWCREYLQAQGLAIDERGSHGYYDLVITSQDLIIQKAIRKSPIILIQEGMTDPENFLYKFVRTMHLPRYIANTSMTGLSNAYEKFCVASEGYKNLFTRKGVDPNKIEVTGIPNWDNAIEFKNNDFPYKGYVLVATSDARETKKHHDRNAFIKRAMEIAGDRQVIFKLHPNENIERATAEIHAIAPQVLVYSNGNCEYMIANCDVLITQYSTVTYIGLALGKEVHTELDLDELKILLPEQNGGKSAERIARICQEYIG